VEASRAIVPLVLCYSVIPDRSAVAGKFLMVYVPCRKIPASAFRWYARERERESLHLDDSMLQISSGTNESIRHLSRSDRRDRKLCIARI